MITFKYIREIYENERKHRNLQELDKDFLEKIKEYFERKQRIMNKSSKTLLDYPVIKEIENFKSLLKNLFELRKKKILLMALNHLTSPSTKIKEEALLDFEKEVYHETVKKLLEYDRFIKESLQLSSPTEKEDEFTHINNSTSNTEKKEVIRDNTPIKEVSEEEKEMKNKEEQQEKKKETDKRKYMVEAIDNIPSFITPSKEFMGPYMKGERFVCDTKIKDLLLRLNKIKILYEIK